MACFVSLIGKSEAMEAWPTSPVLSEEKNIREKEKAHRYYERQLKACSWYSAAPRPSWIEIAQPFDGDNCSQCCYKEPCGCVIVCNEPAFAEAAGSSSSGGQRRLTLGSVRSSLGDGQRVESLTSTEDSKSFYDNLCDFCKVTSLERRSRKYGEWRRRWSAKVHGNAASEEEDEEAEMCTCAMDHLSFIEWKQLYEQNDLVTFSKVGRRQERAERLSTSDYGTQRSKDSEGGTTVACREYPACLTVKTPSLGYNSSCSIPNTEPELDSVSSCSPTVVSDSEGSNIGGDVHGSSTTSNRLTTSPPRPARTPHAYHGFRGNGSHSSDDDDLFGDKLSWVLSRDTARKQTSTNTKHKPQNAKNKTSNSRRKKMRLRKARPKDTTSSDHPHRETTSNSEASTPCSEGETCCGDDKTTCLDSSPSANGLPTICVTETKDNTPPKIPTENDETLPADLLSEFLLIAKSIDEFYESIHAKKFLENRVESTKCDSVEDTTEKPETCSQELKQRIRSLERLCSFVDQSDEDASIRGASPPGGKRLSSIDKEEQPVWRLSQQSLDLMHSRRSRSTSSGSSSNRSGSRSSNSRCSTRQSDHANCKLSETSTENMRYPDSGFSEKASSFSESDSPDACRLGTKWAGSMQWDYTDWYFIGYDCNGDRPDVKEQNLTTIHEAPLAVPQDPLDWDW